MRREQLIEHCIQQVQKKNIQIISGGALFNWCDDRFPPQKSELPTACDGFGAVLIENDLAHEFYPDFPKGWVLVLAF